MSKLSEPLKALINASHARPSTLKAPSIIRSVYSKIASSAASHNVGTPAWLTISTAATMTMNSPESLLELFKVTRDTDKSLDPVHAAEMMREVGLKCISFNGIPRAINVLGAFREGLPKEVSSQLSTKATRGLNAGNVDEVVKRGEDLWKGIYLPFDAKLAEKLGVNHPNMPVHIIQAHYGTLLSDPSSNMPGIKVGRVLTSIVAIACLRAQTGVGPQVLSHVFGLRKAYESGDFEAEGEEPVEGGKWLATDEGSTWLLESVDDIVRAIGQGQGSSFAPGLKAKL